MSQDKPTLVELVLLSSRLVDKIIAAKGETTQEIEDALNNIDLATTVKVDSYVFILKKLAAQEFEWTNTAREVAAAKSACVNASARLIENIKQAMLLADKRELNGEQSRFVLSSHSPKLVLEKQNIPSEYLVETRTYEPDKDLILTKLNNGETITGAHLEPVFTLTKHLSKR